MPTAAAQSLIALDFVLGPTFEIALIDGPDRPATELLPVIDGRFLPNKVVVRRTSDMTETTIPVSLKPLLSGKPVFSSAPGVSVCQQGRCQPAVTSAVDLERLLVNREP